MSKPLPDLPDDVWADVQAVAERLGRDPISMLVQAWRDYAFRRRLEGRML